MAAFRLHRDDPENPEILRLFGSREPRYIVWDCPNCNQRVPLLHENLVTYPDWCIGANPIPPFPYCGVCKASPLWREESAPFWIERPEFLELPYVTTIQQLPPDFLFICGQGRPRRVAETQATAWTGEQEILAGVSLDKPEQVRRFMRGLHVTASFDLYRYFHEAVFKLPYSGITPSMTIARDTYNLASIARNHIESRYGRPTWCNLNPLEVHLPVSFQPQPVGARLPVVYGKSNTVNVLDWLDLSFETFSSLTSAAQEELVQVFLEYLIKNQEGQLRAEAEARSEWRQTARRLFAIVKVGRTIFRKIDDLLDDG